MTPTENSFGHELSEVAVRSHNYLNDFPTRASDCFDPILLKNKMSSSTLLLLPISSAVKGGTPGASECLLFFLLGLFTFKSATSQSLLFSSIIKSIPPSPFPSSVIFSGLLCEPLNSFMALRWWPFNEDADGTQGALVLQRNKQKKAQSAGHNHRLKHKVREKEGGPEGPPLECRQTE